MNLKYRSTASSVLRRMHWLYSPLRMIEFNSSTSLHHILECSLFWTIIPTTGSKMAHTGVMVLWVGLSTNTRSSVIGLILVNSLKVCLGSSSLGQSPTREVLFVTWICTSFRNISAWSNWAWCGGLVLQCLSTTSTISKSIVWSLLDFRSFFR